VQRAFEGVVAALRNVQERIEQVVQIHHDDADAEVSAGVGREY
jgi:hypothetical protein